MVGLHLRFGMSREHEDTARSNTSHRPLRTARRCRSNSGNRSAPWSTKLKGQPLQSLIGSGPVAGTVQQHASGFLTSAWQRRRGSQLHLSCQSPQCTAQRNSPWRPHKWRFVQRQVSLRKHPTFTARQHVCFGNAKGKAHVLQSARDEYDGEGGVYIHLHPHPSQAERQKKKISVAQKLPPRLHSDGIYKKEVSVWTCR